MPARKSQFQVWYEQVKRELLVTEPQNILARSECCQNIINECVSHMNMNLELSPVPPSERYCCNIVPSDHLKFLLNWPGLRVDNSPKAPKTKKEYEKKSKNWLNGRRAPNYGKTLFPFFVSSAERYLSQIAKLLIKNDPERQKLYYDIIIYKILAQLCGCSVSLHEQAKKAPFFCKNSVERKGRLKEILQSYASEHEYIQGFPSCFEEAIGFFDKKSNEYFHQYRCHYLGYNDNGFGEDDGDSSIDNMPSVRSTRAIKTDPFRSNHTQNRLRPSTMLRKQRHDIPNVDAEYWKNQYMNLKRELAIERQRRIKAERDLEGLKRMNHHQVPPSTHDFGRLPLDNDASFGSINGSESTGTVSTNNGNNNHIQNMQNMQNMPPLQPSHSFGSHQSRSTQHSQPQHDPSLNIMDMDIRSNQFQINHMNSMNNNMYRNQHNLSNNLCVNANYIVPRHQTTHSMGPPMVQTVPHNMNNMNNMNNNNFVPSHQPNLSSLNEGFSSIPMIDSMPIMIPKQISNDSFSGFGCDGFPKSPAPMYSYQSHEPLVQ